MCVKYALMIEGASCICVVTQQPKYPHYCGWVIKSILKPINSEVTKYTTIRNIES